jgi:hypothetical protein
MLAARDLDDLGQLPQRAELAVGQPAQDRVAS